MKQHGRHDRTGISRFTSIQQGIFETGKVQSRLWRGPAWNGLAFTLARLVYARDTVFTAEATDAVW